MLRTVEKLTLWCALLVAATAALWSQAIFATLSGVVTDPSGAVVANAKVTLKNADSGSLRNTVTDNQGYYSFASVPVGTYDLTVEQTGFETSKVNAIALGGGETRSVNTSLQVGNTNQTVEVSGTSDIVTPVDSGEKSFLLTTQQLENYVQVGSNAAEYIKIVPGFGVQNGVSNKSNYSGQTIGINANGDGGSQSPLNNAFSYNGLPGNTLDIVADGAHVSDPGCNCDTPVNPNSDFLQEFRVLTSNFNAEDQKGPMVITSVTKAGGASFHGNAFFSARNYVLNSNDSYSNALGIKRPQDKYYYPGGSIGGPVLIPWTRFNHDHNKLFFFTGYEYFYQVLDTGDLTATVPTAGMINGNFSPSELAKLGTKTASGGPPGTVPASWPGGQMPTSLIDPSMQALMKLYPAPNADPNATGGYNYVQSEIFNQNNYQWTVRGDYNVSDNTKVFVRYNMQRETQQFPVGLWWRNTDQVPYPTPIQGKNRSDSVTGTLTHVFSPTMTNETVFAYTFVGFPNVFENPAKVDRKTVGYNDPSLFPHTTTPVAQIPSFGGSGASEAALIFNPGGFEAGGASAGLYANKYMPSVSDTLTKVWGTHTAKAGFFYEWIRNAQPASNNTNGDMTFVPSSNPTFTYGDAYADMLAGNLSSYQEQNFNRINEISYHTYEGFIQDSWKVTSRLTAELGLRLTHFTPWSDDEGYGYSIFDPSQYNPANGGACAQGPTFCGFNWHSRDAAVPLGGFPQRTLFYQPRLGFAYDVTGKGKMVLRGGWGRFYYHSGQFTSGLDTSAGSEGITLNPSNIAAKPTRLLASQLNTISFSAVPATPSAVDSRDTKQPYTDSYNFTIDQRTPWSGLLEVAYVGNRSRDLQSTGGFGSNLNLVPVGSMFSAANPGNANSNTYRPYAGYGDINLATNNLYANYNALQISWAHQASRATIQVNYTYGKALGIVGSGTTLGSFGATLDPFNLQNNYGAQTGDRRHIFNAAYSINLPSPVHGNKFAAGAINGWQLSGITQLESGANLTNNSGFNYNWQLNGAILPGSQNLVNTGGTNGIPINNQSLLGTSSIQLNPILTCNPTANLGPHQFLNGNCFAVPTQIGENGPSVMPAFYGPAFFNSDLGIFKNFQIKESMKLQFRVQAQNFLNHPLWSFPTNNNLTLQFNQASPGSTSIPQTNSSFGVAPFKQGQRIVELVVKFYF
ncbi:MAG TPA: carboxypeptidase-like regulatory domain-containing protein [Bryobacteraceae bacterium]|nr:carboxypeptidase-like regulatory domain-containing protein [Bryobacteraceae bacterium]